MIGVNMYLTINSTNWYYSCLVYHQYYKYISNWIINTIEMLIPLIIPYANSWN